MCAFQSCSNLQRIKIPNGVTLIAEHAFWNCMSLKEIEIPNTVQNIGVWAFDGCTHLCDVYFTGSEDEWNSINVDDYNYCLLDANIHYNMRMYDENDPENTVVYGDINRDGKVTAKDSMAVQRYAIKLSDLNDAQLKAADVDKDGKVTSKDAMYILRCSINLTVLPVVK